MSDGRFAGRAVLVTGGGSGIGRVMAMRFAAEAAAVVVVDIAGEKAEDVVREIVEAGGKAIAVRADSGSSFGIVSKTPRMMKTLTASARV